MANEITVTLNLNVQNPSTGRGFAQSTRRSGQFTQNAVGVNDQTVSVPTTAAGTAYTFANLTTYGVLFIENLDDTNFVELGVQVAGTFYPLVRVNPGEFQYFRLSHGISLYLRADTAAVDVHYQLYED